MPRPGAMIYLVSYDIPDNRRRLRLAHYLEEWGVRVQWSVFECQVSSTNFRRLREGILELIERAEDNVRIYPVCATCAGQIERLGVEESVRLDEHGLYF